MVSDKKQALNYLSKFSNLTRTILELTEKETISIAEEVKTLSLYLEIEKARFDDDFDYQIIVAPEIDSEQTKIPSMLLQPYVENAIKHGISNRLKGGEIIIKCYEGLTDDLYIQVKNSGQLKSQPFAKKKNGEGHGITNTIQRLKLIYGERASFKIFNSGNDFVITEIKIPKQSLTLG